MNALSGRLVLVLGIGESGLAMARWCAREGARLRVADTRDEPPGLNRLLEAVPDAQVILGPFTAELLDGVELVASSPGIDLRQPVFDQARERGIAVAGEMALFADALARLDARGRTRIIAITGTNGKTTTTALTAAMCRAAGLDAVAAGNISPAALTVLMDRLDHDAGLPECWVLELSSFQIEIMGDLCPDAATVLNISDDHLDRHSDLDTYAAIKARIFAGTGAQVLNRDDPRVMTMGVAGRRCVTVGSDTPGSPDDYGIARDAEGLWLVRGVQPLVRTDMLQLAGRHNVVNALAALALGAAIGCDMQPMIEVLKVFRGLPHRMELVARRRDGVPFYNDSKGTNVGATVAALEGLESRAVLIAGGDGKGQDFSPLRPAVERHARAVLLIGRDAPLIERALAGLGVTVECVSDLETAVVRASAIAREGDAVLLSPACSSLDAFRNYVHRGERFIAAVRRLPEVTAP
ncbi:MAG TPA: UDP-N-acetylmuramoyl-L-alanine--D-glutamate ligase [Rhodocyclaceae bacterium]|nr:UDP-N-acetylmuramoyl-L-alanine--D-glutamate ligase [Rhodocyclaceae bacterium]